MRLFASSSLLSGLLLTASSLASDGYRRIELPPDRGRFRLEAPLAGLPPTLLDSLGNGFGIAQGIARRHGLQGRIMWIDATANLDRVDSPEKIEAQVERLAAIGFNTIVYDVKPIVGWTTYPSDLTRQVLEWRGKTFPAGFDPLKHFVEACRRHAIPLFVSLNAFSEGHQMFRLGPGYERPDLQTVMLEATPILELVGYPERGFPVARQRGRFHPEGAELTLVTGTVPPEALEGLAWVVVGPDRRVAQRGEGSPPAPPSGGFVYAGRGPAAEWIRRQATSGWPVRMVSRYAFVPLGERPERQIPLMMNPHLPENQQRGLDFVREILGRYRVDGIVFDDRLRFGGLDADFSEYSRKKFEEYVGRPLAWPHDVYQVTYGLDLTSGVRPGPYWDAWLAWRAATLQDWVRQVRELVDRLAPGTLFGVYQGSWYGEYQKFGSNWASPQFDGDFAFLTRTYRRTGFAPLVDFVIAGCYYRVPTIARALAAGLPAGRTVEAGGQLANAAVRDEAWTYAGIMLMDYFADPSAVEDALQAAVASTQGVMVFDLSHRFEQFEPVLRRAFRSPARPPHARPDLLRLVRSMRRSLDARGVGRPTFLHEGAPGTGF